MTPPLPRCRLRPGYAEREMARLLAIHDYTAAALLERHQAGSWYLHHLPNGRVRISLRGTRGIVLDCEAVKGE